MDKKEFGKMWRSEYWRYACKLYVIGIILYVIACGIIWMIGNVDKIKEKASNIKKKFRRR